MASITAVPPWLIVTATDSARRLVRSVRTWICTCSKRATERKWQLKVAGALEGGVRGRGTQCDGRDVAPARAPDLPLRGQFGDEPSARALHGRIRGQVSHAGDPDQALAIAGAV
jgi:hypothetical protein